MKFLLSIIITIILFTSCGSRKAELELTSINDYAPLTVGKYITYSVDSLVFTNFGTTETHRFYEVKHLVADTFRDNLGRKAYRITRLIRKVPVTDNFVPEYTFSAVSTDNTFEFIENNLRFIKLTLPIKNAYIWKGNSYINLNASIFPGVPNSYFLEDWDYTYENVDDANPINLPGFTIANTVTVNQKDLSSNLPVTGTTNIANRDFGKEVYGKGIGMIYREFIHWEYQTGTKYTGWGIKMKMIDKN
jgi:hypothetical protein